MMPTWGPSSCNKQIGLTRPSGAIVNSDEKASPHIRNFNAGRYQSDFPRRPASVGSDDSCCRPALTIPSRSLSVDAKSSGFMDMEKTHFRKVITEANKDEMHPEDGAFSSKKPSDVGYLFILKKQIIYRIPIILDITRIDESRREKSVTSERGNTILSNNPHEFCVIMKNNGAAELESALMGLFKFCDWVKILSAAPLPDQVRRDLATPNLSITETVPSVKRQSRSIPAHSIPVPIKKICRSSNMLKSLTNERLANGSPNVQTTELINEEVENTNTCAIWKLGTRNFKDESSVRSVTTWLSTETVKPEGSTMQLSTPNSTNGPKFTSHASKATHSFAKDQGRPDSILDMQIHRLNSHSDVQIRAQKQPNSFRHSISIHGLRPSDIGGSSPQSAPTSPYFRHQSLSAIAASAKMDEVMTQQRSSVERSLSSAPKFTTKDISDPHTQQHSLIQHPLRMCSFPGSSEGPILNDVPLASQSIPEAQTLHFKSLPFVSRNTTRTAIALAEMTSRLAPVQTLPQRPPYSNGVKTRQTFTMGAAAGIRLSTAQPSRTSTEGTVAYAPAPTQVMRQLTASHPHVQLPIGPSIACAKCQGSTHYASIGSNQETPMDLSIKISEKASSETLARQNDTTFSACQLAVSSNEEDGVINLAYSDPPNSAKSQLESSNSEASLKLYSSPKRETLMKCQICNLDFEMDWWLKKHYRGRKHVCRLLESVGGSEGLQKQIKSREINSETLVNEKTGKLLLHVVNRLINSNGCTRITNH